MDFCLSGAKPLPEINAIEMLYSYNTYIVIDSCHFYA